MTFLNSQYFLNWIILAKRMFHQTDRVYYKTTFTYYQGFQISKPPLWYYFGTTHKVLSGYDLPLKQKREPLKVLRVVITRASYGLGLSLSWQLRMRNSENKVRLWTFRMYSIILNSNIGSEFNKTDCELSIQYCCRLHKLFRNKY